MHEIVIRGGKDHFTVVQDGSTRFPVDLRPKHRLCFRINWRHFAVGVCPDDLLAIRIDTEHLAGISRTNENATVISEVQSSRSNVAWRHG